MLNFKIIKKILNNEFILPLDPNDDHGLNEDARNEAIVDRTLQYAIKYEIFKISEETGEIRALEQGRNKLKFFGILLQKFIDTYFIVMYTINELMEKNFVIEQQKLVNQLHVGIQAIYNRGAIKFIDSCHFEIINTAFERFSELGVCKSLAYDTSSDNKIVYLQSPMANRALIENYMTILTQLCLGSSDKVDKKLNMIEQEIKKVIALAQGPMARLWKINSFEQRHKDIYHWICT